MDDLIKELKELEELVLQCMKCGTCQAHCPLYQKDLLESTVARGKISLIESV
ncbi:MAG: (Fe-S)-binding protein, partial [Deferribacterales bacterium]|nr:(Fe-S)-binding protein [Deferribacterales bacterium]